MSSSPRIVVFKMREILYTLLLIFLVVLLIVCLVLMFSKKKTGQGTSAGQSQTQVGQTADQQMQSSEAKIQTLPTEAVQNTSDSSQTNTAQNSSGSVPDTSSELASDSGNAVETSLYVPGIYTAPITLGDSTVDVEVTVDEDRINSIRLVNLSEATAASFPLVSPSLEHITAQILETQSLTGITAAQESRYTSQMLLSAVADALETARK